MRILFIVVFCLSGLSVSAQESDNSREVVGWPTMPEFYKIPAVKDSVTVLAMVDIVSLPDNIIQYKNLKRIDIFDSPKINLDKVVLQIKKLPSVVALGFAGCGFRAFPVEICSLTQLKSLAIVRDSLGIVPPDLSRLINLQVLDLGDMLSGGDNINVFNADLSTLKNLHYLWLFGNHLKTLPEGIEKLPLYEIDMKANELSDISGLYKINTLKSLYLADNNIKALGKDIVLLTNLNELYLSGNPLGKLPKINGTMNSVTKAEFPKQWEKGQRKIAASIFPKAEIGYY
jgi:Leucine-rich repeat (LRR) protein